MPPTPAPPQLLNTPSPPLLNAPSPPSLNAPPSPLLNAPPPSQPVMSAPQPPPVAPQLRQHGLHWIRRGLLSIVIGIAITTLTYVAASGGGFYVVGYGPVIWGVVYLVRGVKLLVKSGRM